MFSNLSSILSLSFTFMSSRSSRIIRASVVQTCTQAYSLEQTLVKLDSLTRQAKNEKSELAVFPEAFIGGYPKYSTFGAVVGERAASGRDEFLRYHESAIEIPSPTITRMENISRETNVFLIVGVIERDGGTLYCTAVFIDPLTGYAGKHRKLAPTGSERLIWGQGDGSTLPVLEVQASNVEKTKVSAAICWENYMPLLRYFYYGKGVEIYCAPTVDARPQWQNTMIHIALEGRCFVLSACQYAQEKDYPAEHPVADVNDRVPEKVMIAGGSVIVSPLGKVLAGPLLGAEGVLTADLDLDDCIRGKFDLDVVGHYARSDVFSFSANIPQ